MGSSAKDAGTLVGQYYGLASPSLLLAPRDFWLWDNLYMWLLSCLAVLVSGSLTNLLEVQGEAWIRHGEVFSPNFHEEGGRMKGTPGHEERGMDFGIPVIREETTLPSTASGLASSSDFHVLPAPWLIRMVATAAVGKDCVTFQPLLFVSVSVCVQTLICRHTQVLVFHCLGFGSVTFLGKVTDFSLEGIVS